MISRLDPRKKREWLAALREMAAHLERQEVAKSCQTCSFWTNGRCELAGAVPPSEVADASDDSKMAAAEEGAKQAEAGETTDASVPVMVARNPPSNAATPTAAATPPSLPAVEVAELLARGDGYLGKGDVASARLFYERAADAGSGQGAMRLGATFDPNFLGRAGLVGTRGDQARADMWYHRARGLDTAAAPRESNSRETR